MATTNPQDKTGTAEAPHAQPDEHPDPNPSEEHLSLDHSKGQPTHDILESSDLAKEHPIPDRPEEQPSSNNSEEHPRLGLSEEHPEPNLSKSTEELLRDFENYQKKQLQILRAITQKVCLMW